MIIFRIEIKPSMALPFLVMPPGLGGACLSVFQFSQNFLNVFLQRFDLLPA